LHPPPSARLTKVTRRWRSCGAESMRSHYPLLAREPEMLLLEEAESKFTSTCRGILGCQGRMSILRRLPRRLPQRVFPIVGIGSISIEKTILIPSPSKLAERSTEHVFHAPYTHLRPFQRSQFQHYLESIKGSIKETNPGRRKPGRKTENSAHVL